MAEETTEKSIQTLVHEALERNAAAGSLYAIRKAAAAELGMTMGEIKNKIYESPDLRRRWANDEEAPLDEADAFSRETLPVADVKIAEAVERENRKLRKGLHALGLTEAEQHIAFELKQFNQNSFRSVMDMAIASAARINIKFTLESDRIFARLELVRMQLLQMGAEISEERQFLVQEEKSLTEQLALIGGLQIRNMDKTVEASSKLALVNHKIKNGGNGPMKKVKPAFQEIGSQTIEVS